MFQNFGKISMFIGCEQFVTIVDRRNRHVQFNLASGFQCIRNGCIYWDVGNFIRTKTNESDSSISVVRTWLPFLPFNWHSLALVP